MTILMDIGNNSTTTADSFGLRPRASTMPEVIHVPAKEFGGEDKKNGVAYLFVLWFVSLLAFITNNAKALWVKAKNPNKKWKAILWEMGRDKNHVSSILVDGISQFNHQAKIGAAGMGALCLFYDYHTSICPQLGNNLEGRLTKFWVGNMENRQAVTNRLKLTTQILTETNGRFFNESEIRILSIACGSAQAVIEMMKNCSHLNIKAMLFDVDENALQEARRLVDEADLNDRFIIQKGTTTQAIKAGRKFRPHVVEMVGFMDYRPKDKAITLVGRIFNILPKGGVFVTCNIRPNLEKCFLDWVLLWPMIYRNTKQFADVLLGGGFKKDDIKIVCEPLNIHSIGVCIK